MADKAEKTSEKKNLSIHERLSEIQTKLKAPKGQVNSFGNYSYRSCEDILEAVKPHLEGLTLTLSDEIVNLGDRYYVKATAKLSNGTDNIENTAFAREAQEKKGMDESQITGAASSYARKYALNGLFAIDDTKDADTMDNTKQASSSPASGGSNQNAQIELMKKFGMDTKQKAPKCANCGTPMNLVPRKDGTNLFWSCVNWRSKGCKGLNVDDVDIDGNIGGKNAPKPVAANPQSDENDEDIPF